MKQETTTSTGVKPVGGGSSFLIVSLAFVASFLMILWNNQEAHNRVEENRRHQEKMREFEGRGSDDY